MTFGGLLCQCFVCTIEVCCIYVRLLAAHAQQVVAASAQVDTSGMTLEQGLFRNFDDIVRRQLDAVWHTVSPRTKQARTLWHRFKLQVLQLL